MERVIQMYIFSDIFIQLSLDLLRMKKWAFFFPKILKTSSDTSSCHSVPPGPLSAAAAPGLLISFADLRFTSQAHSIIGWLTANHVTGMIERQFYNPMGDANSHCQPLSQPLTGWLDRSVFRVPCPAHIRHQPSGTVPDMADCQSLSGNGWQ